MNTQGIAKRTIIATDYGMFRLSRERDLAEFTAGNASDTLTIELDSGIQLSCTPGYIVWNGERWVDIDELCLGDKLPVQYGQQVESKGVDITQYIPKHAYTRPDNRAPTVEDLNRYDDLRIHPQHIDQEDFYYLCGIIQIAGSYVMHSIVVSREYIDTQMRAFLAKFGFRKADNRRGDYVLQSNILANMIYAFGVNTYVVPNAVLQAQHRDIYAFLRGVFADPFVSVRYDGVISLTIPRPALLRDLQAILLNFGILSEVMYSWDGVTYMLVIDKYAAYLFEERIKRYIIHDDDEGEVGAIDWDEVNLDDERYACSSFYDTIVAFKLDKQKLSAPAFQTATIANGLYVARKWVCNDEREE